MFVPTLFPRPWLLHHLSVNESTFLGNGPQGSVEYFTNKIEPRVRLLHHVVLRLAATTVDANFPGENNNNINRNTALHWDGLTEGISRGNYRTVGLAGKGRVKLNLKLGATGTTWCMRCKRHGTRNVHT